MRARNGIRQLLTCAGLAAAAFTVGCAGDESTTEARDRVVYVGTAEQTDTPGKTISVGLAVHERQLSFFACGDEDMETFSAWVAGTIDDESGAENPIHVTTQRWKLDGMLSGGEVEGTLRDLDSMDPSPAFSWSATMVDEGGAPGLYANQTPCPTGVVVLPGGAVSGSYCMPNSGIRAQVTPLTPPPGESTVAGLWSDAETGGIFVGLETAEPVLVVPVDPAAVPADSE